MNIAPRHHPMARGDERMPSIIAVILVHIAIGLALVRGLAVQILPVDSPLTQLIQLSLPPVPPPPLVVHQPRQAKSRAAAATPAVPAPKGGPQGPAKLKTVAPTVTRAPVTTAPAPGGGAGIGTATGSGAGGGTGGNGDGDGDGEGGSDLVQVAGEITSRDYPRDLREAGVGGRVGILFTVEPSGRVGRCAVTRSSGSLQLDQLTCRLIQQRFRYRPSTDRSGRPIADEVDGEHVWESRGR